MKIMLELTLEEFDKVRAVLEGKAAPAGGQDSPFEVEAAPVEAPQSVSKAQLMQMAREAMSVAGEVAIRRLVSEYGVTAIYNLPEDKYGAAYEALEALVKGGSPNA